MSSRVCPRCGASLNGYLTYIIHYFQCSGKPEAARRPSPAPGHPVQGGQPAAKPLKALSHQVPDLPGLIETSRAAFSLPAGGGAFELVLRTRTIPKMNYTVKCLFVEKYGEDIPLFEYLLVRNGKEIPLVTDSSWRQEAAEAMFRNPSAWAAGFPHEGEHPSAFVIRGPLEASFSRTICIDLEGEKPPRIRNGKEYEGAFRLRTKEGGEELIAFRAVFDPGSDRQAPHWLGLLSRNGRPVQIASKGRSVTISDGEPARRVGTFNDPPSAWFRCGVLVNSFLKRGTGIDLAWNDVDGYVGRLSSDDSGEVYNTVVYSSENISLSLVETLESGAYEENSSCDLST